MILTQDPTITGADVHHVSPTLPLQVNAARIVIQGPIVIPAGVVVIHAGVLETRADSANRAASISVIGRVGTSIPWHAQDGHDSPFGTRAGDGEKGEPGGNGGDGGTITIVAREFSAELALTLIADGGIGGRGQDGGNGGASSGENGDGGDGGRGGNGGDGGAIAVFYGSAKPTITMTSEPGGGGQAGSAGSPNTTYVPIPGPSGSPGTTSLEPIR